MGPKKIDKRCLKDQKVAALCALNAIEGILRQYWFEGSRIRSITENGERYREVINRINENLNQLVHLHLLLANRIWSL